MIDIHPLGARVLLRHRALEEKTGSLYRANALRKEYARVADVLAVGPEVRDIKPGDVVHVPVLAGQAIEDLVLVPESSILAVLDAAS